MRAYAYRIHWFWSFRVGFLFFVFLSSQRLGTVELSTIHEEPRVWSYLLLSGYFLCLVCRINIVSFLQWKCGVQLVLHSSVYIYTWTEIVQVYSNYHMFIPICFIPVY